MDDRVFEKTGKWVPPDCLELLLCPATRVTPGGTHSSRCFSWMILCWRWARSWTPALTSVANRDIFVRWDTPTDKPSRHYTSNDFENRRFESTKQSGEQQI